jgi:hypothetical protein
LMRWHSTAAATASIVACRMPLRHARTEIAQPSVRQLHTTRACLVKLSWRPQPCRNRAGLSPAWHRPRPRMPHIQQPHVLSAHKHVTKHMSSPAFWRFYARTATHVQLVPAWRSGLEGARSRGISRAAPSNRQGAAVPAKPVDIVVRLKLDTSTAVPTGGVNSALAVRAAGDTLRHAVSSCFRNVAVCTCRNDACVIMQEILKLAGATAVQTAVILGVMWCIDKVRAWLLTAVP